MGLYVYFGIPGTGKTTHAASIVLRNLKKGWPTYSNVPIQGAFLLDPGDIGTFDISYCDLIVDEASIEYNNRKFKTLGQNVIEWYKLYRHHHVRDIYVYSQSWDDMDITLRRLASHLYMIERTIIPGLRVIREIQRMQDIDPQTHQIIDGYRFGLKPSFLFLPRYYHMFNSWDAQPLPRKEWPVCGFGDRGGIDPTPGNRQLRGLYKLVKARRRQVIMAKLRRLKEKIIPPKDPDPPDPWVAAVLRGMEESEESKGL